MGHIKPNRCAYNQIKYYHHHHRRPCQPGWWNEPPKDHRLNPKSRGESYLNHYLGAIHTMIISTDPTSGDDKEGFNAMPAFNSGQTLWKLAQHVPVPKTSQSIEKTQRTSSLFFGWPLFDAHPGVCFPICIPDSYVSWAARRRGQMTNVQKQHKPQWRRGRTLEINPA